jgi:hypothetical protein
LDRIRKARKARLGEVVDDALRKGLRQMSEERAPRVPFRTKSVSLGRCLIADFDNVAESLAAAEGEGFQ